MIKYNFYVVQKYWSLQFCIVFLFVLYLSEGVLGKEYFLKSSWVKNLNQEKLDKIKVFQLLS
jgi:hypothetical protein